MTKIYLVSGDGIGAGKSTFCRRMCDETWSLAGALRHELKRMFPQYDWFNKEQVYKNTQFREVGRLRDLTGIDSDIKTVRDVLVIYGQKKCEDDPVYWVKQMMRTLLPRLQIADGLRVVGVDDLRKIVELEYFREVFERDLTHFHISSGRAVPEQQFDNEELKKRADYVLSWGPVNVD